MTPGPYDAIVIGAGPAGSTAAILLAQAGWTVALVERQPFPRRKVCGECVAATNLPLLDALGVGESFRALAGAELRSVALLFGSRSVCAPLPAAAHGRDPWGRALGREHLDTLLLARAQALGVHVWQPWVAERLHGASGDFCCELRAAAADRGASGARVTLRAPVAIHAQGSWYTTPDRLRKTDLLGFKANFTGVRLTPGVLPVLCFRGGYGGMVVADHDMTTVACCIQAGQLRACRRSLPSEPAGSVVEHHLRSQCAGVHAALEGATRIGPWLAVGPIRPGLHWRARASRATAEDTAFRIGNAVGEAHPIIGEGISMALQSAWLLATELIACPDARARGTGALAAQCALKQRYVRAWHRHFATRTRHAALLARAAMRPAIMAALMPVMCRRPALLTGCARWSGKIQCAPTAEVVASRSGGAVDCHAIRCRSPAARISPTERWPSSAGKTSHDDAGTPDADPGAEL